MKSIHDVYLEWDDEKHFYTATMPNVTPPSPVGKGATSFEAIDDLTRASVDDMGSWWENFLRRRRND